MIRAFHRAASFEEALALKRENPAAAWLAGGTELVYRQRKALEAVIDVSRLPLGTREELPGGGLRLGALLTLQSLSEGGFPDRRLAAIGQAAGAVRNRNIRNMATLGGNLAARRPSSDLAPVLLVLDARMEYLAGDGSRQLEPLSAWLQRTDDPLLLAVRVDPPAPGECVQTRSFTRVACDLALVNAAARIRFADGALTGLRLACGCLDAKTRVFDLDELAPSLPLTDEGALRAALRAWLTARVQPRDDHRASAAYRLDLASLLAAEMIFAARTEGEDAA